MTSNDLKIEQLEPDELCFEVIDGVKGMPFLFLMLTEEAKLESFSIEPNYFTNDQVLSKEAVLKKAIKLVDVFITDDRRLEVWSNQPVKQTEFEEADVLEIYFDEENRVSRLSSSPEEENTRLYKSAEEALERAIDAKTGQPWFIDASCMGESES